jgi:hypothetical protein
MAHVLLKGRVEVAMEVESAKHQPDVSDVHCLACGAPLASGELCRLCERRGLSPQQYAEFFWEEA